MYYTGITKLLKFTTHYGSLQGNYKFHTKTSFTKAVYA